MKVSCQSCSAKYTIADEKVAGRIVKIRCKKCGATIVVNGNEMKADAAADAAAEAEVWTLSVDDTDQRTMTAAEVATAYKSGIVNDETFCWKEGMDDWLPLREIEALAGAVGMRVSLMPASLEDNHGGGGGGDLFGSGFSSGSSAGSDVGLGGGGLFGDAPLAAAAPAAARRSGARGGGGDLFGSAATAGGEEEVMTSAPGLSAPPSGDAKLTGQRNENSVLFSLNALTSHDAPSGGGGGRGATTAEGDGSGLIDIRALSSSMNTTDNSSSKVDDIMNLSGGGAFNAALTAPVLAPPMMIGGGAGGVSNSFAPEPQQTSSGKGLMFGLMGLGAFILIAVLVVVFAFKDDGKDDSTAKNDPIKTAEPDKPTTADPNSGTANMGTGTTGTTPAASGSTNAVAPNVGGATATAGTPGKTGGKPGAVATNDKPTETPSKPAETPSKPTSLTDAMNNAAGKKPDAPSGGNTGGSSAPFDKGAALAALGGVNVASCKKDASGNGHVKIVFAPSGTVSSATVDDGPFVGTPTGGCVAGKYRGAKVPPFSGSPVTVGKSFSIN